MYAITGITGKVGGQVSRFLMQEGQAVRAVVRDARKGVIWQNLGCDLAVADMSDAKTLTAAFKGTSGVFILLPPIFDPSPNFPETRSTIAAIREALNAARHEKIVCISTIGAQAERTNLLTQLKLMEQSLGELPTPIAFLRPAWFMENCSWDVGPAREEGLIRSFLQPLDKPVPIVATADVAQTAAELLQDNWTGRRVVELQGPTRVTPNEIAATFASILGHSIQAMAVPRDTWEEIFRSQGMKYPEPRIQMLDGFNQGWIDFEQAEVSRRKGGIGIEQVLKELARGD
jgi:uncharacterized protein YbjT (DUF2867 family)